MKVNVSPDAGPTAVNNSVTAVENHTYTFKVSDFGYADAAGSDPLGSVTLTSLPNNGTIY